MIEPSLTSHFMVDAARARKAASNAVTAHDRVMIIAAFVNHAMKVYRKGTGEIASELLLPEADVWNARVLTDRLRAPL